MSDEPSGGGPRSSDQWGDVLHGLDEFGDAVSRWVRATVNDPKNRERASELKTHFNSAAEKVSDAVQDVSATSAGQSVRDAAGQTGEAFKQAGEKFTSEVAPSLADLFKSAAAGLTEAAARMESRSAPAATDGPESGSAEETPAATPEPEAGEDAESPEG
jgi:hypothetical protein